MSKKQEKNKVMGRPKGSKNKPKKEVIKMKAKDLEIKSANEIIASDDAQVSVKIELKVTKDDIFNLLVEKKENELDKVIDEKFKSLVELNKRRGKIYTDIYEELAHPDYKKDVDLNKGYYYCKENEEPHDEEYFDTNHYIRFLTQIINFKRKYYTCYDITKLSQMHNPKASSAVNKWTQNSIKILGLKDYTMSHTYKIQVRDRKYVYERQGDYHYYTLLPMNSEELEKFQNQINELNAIYQETEKVDTSLREAQYNRLILDKDRSLRNELTKAIIAGVDVRTLLNA